MVRIVKNAKSELVFTPAQKESADGIKRGFFIVESKQMSMEGGFIKENRVTAVLNVEAALAEKLVWKEGTILPGKIIVNESYTPFYDGQPAKINPTTKEIFLVNGKPVYRQAQYTENAELTNHLLVNTESKAEIILPKGSLSGALNK